MATPAPLDAARRTRAALAFAGIDVKESGERVGISYATMQRIVSLTNPRGFQLATELEMIADACKVPRSFLAEGFAPDQDELADRVETLERQVAALLKRYEADAPPAPPGVGPRQPSSARSSAASQEPGNPGAPDGR